MLACIQSIDTTGTFDCMAASKSSPLASSATRCVTLLPCIVLANLPPFSVIKLSSSCSPLSSGLPAIRIPWKIPLCGPMSLHSWSDWPADGKIVSGQNSRLTKVCKVLALEKVLNRLYDADISFNLIPASKSARGRGPAPSCHPRAIASRLLHSDAHESNFRVPYSCSSSRPPKNQYCACVDLSRGHNFIAFLAMRAQRLFFAPRNAC